MKSKLAKARDKWLLSEEGQRCCHGTATGQYLQNRLKSAFIAGADFSAKRIHKRIKANPSESELEAENKRLHVLLREEVDDGRAEVDDMGYEAWLEQALKGE